MIESILIIIILALCYKLYGREAEDDNFELDDLRNENEFLKLKINLLELIIREQMICKKC